MAVLAYNEILPKKIIIYNDEPYIVISAHVFRKQQRKPVNQTKLKSLATGKVVEPTFHQNETAREADVSTRTITFVFENRGQYTFCNPEKPADRFMLGEDLVGSQGKFLKAKSEVEALVYDEKIIGLKFPIKVELKVTEAMPAVKGNTAQGASKEVKLETGATIFAPMFINEGDIISVNTETGEYAERIEKA